MKLALQIAYRFLKSGKAQTWFIILGIAIGVSVQVFIGSLITGLQKSLVDKTIGSSSHIEMRIDEDYISDYDTVIHELETQDSRIKVLLPTLDFNVNGYNEDQTAPVIVRSFDLTKVDEIYGLSEKLENGKLPTGDNEVVLGKYFKEELDLKVGSELTIKLPDNREYQLTVVDFFDFNVRSVNEAWAIVSLETGQTIIDQAVISSIEMQVNDDNEFSAREISGSIANQYSTFTVTNWMDNNEELLSGLQGQSISSIMIQVFVVISVVIGIASVLAIIVMQKSKQIGILKAMGIKDSDASLIFLFEGMILGVLGAVFGVALGLILAYVFTIFAVTSDGTPVVPLYIDYQFILLSSIIAIVASMAAALVPARKSSKLSVIEVIRNG